MSFKSTIYIYIYIYTLKAAFYKRVQNLTYITFNREEIQVLELSFPNNFLNQHINLSQI